MRLQKGGWGGFFLLVVAMCSFISSTKEALAFRVVQIDQAKIRLVLPAGGVKSGILEVSNDSEEPKQIKVYPEDWLYEKSDGSKTFLTANTTMRSCSSWISFSPAEFTVPAFGKAYLNYLIKVPEDVKGGGYYSILFFESSLGEVPKPEETIGATAVVPVAVRVGSLFYIEIEGTVKQSIELGKLSIERAESSEPLKIELAFENKGNVDLFCGGTYDIMGKDNMVYARGRFEDVYTMPADKASFTATWKDAIPKGVYDIIITLDLGKAWEEFGIKKGPVLVKEATIEFGDKGEVLKVGELK